MISVSEARARLFALISPLGEETVALPLSNGRTLIRPVAARRQQPPFAASSMDGYAVKTAEVEPDAMFQVIGEAAAGHGFEGTVGPGQTVRIFTGAPLPEGADFVVIQEDITRKGDLATITGRPGAKNNVRSAGVDFEIGQTVDAPRRIGVADIALLAAMNIAQVPVARKPRVALISTGDELVMPGETPGPDQIIASNTFGLKAMLEDAGAQARILPIARDSEASLHTAFDLARGADLIVTVGGASVGDHDLVAPAAEQLGMERAFYKIAMRPGKPLMAGRLGDAAMVGLPGNPVSALVCGALFLVPMVRAMLGYGTQAPALRSARLATDIGANGPREHYMRAQVEAGDIRAFDNQDSSLLRVLSEANALLVRPPNDPARKAGDFLDYLPV